MIQITKSIEIKTSIHKAFAFHADLSNISQVIPNFIKLQIEKLEWPFGQGAEAVLSFKLFGFINLPEWKLKLIEYQKPYYFTDQEIGGLFDFFEHKHEFSEVNTETTLLKDTITYSFRKSLAFFDTIVFNLLWERFLTEKLQATKKVMEHSQ